MVVGLSGEDVVSGVPVTFPLTIRTSSARGGTIVHTHAEVEEPRVTVYLQSSAGLDLVRVLAPGGEVVLEITDLPPGKAERQVGPLDIRRKQQPLSRAQLAARYAQ